MYGGIFLQNINEPCKSTSHDYGLSGLQSSSSSSCVSYGLQRIIKLKQFRKIAFLMSLSILATNLMGNFETYKNKIMGFAFNKNKDYKIFIIKTKSFIRHNMNRNILNILVLSGYPNLLFEWNTPSIHENKKICHNIWCKKPHIYHTLVYSNNSYKKVCDIVVNSKHNKTKY